MNKEFRNVVIPVVKGLPILAIFALIGLYLGKRLILYSATEYRTHASVKIDNRDAGKLDFQLYNNGVMPSLTAQQNFLTEIEVFKSKQLRKATFKKLKFDINYYRVGEIKQVELYNNCPFKIEFTILDSVCMDKLSYLEYLGENAFSIRKNKEGLALDTLGFEKKWVGKDFVISIKQNESFIKEKANSLLPGDLFAFKFNSLNSLVKSVQEKNFYVKPVDKEISVLKVYYNHEIPEKAALFVNTLIDTYIENNQDYKSARSSKTLRFIRQKLKGATVDLKKAEAELAGFKSENNLVNANQETDAALKEVTQLDMQKVNLELQEAELQNLFTFIEMGGSLNDFSPNFEALKDGVLKDAYLKVQGYELQKVDLLNKYAKTSDEIRIVNEKVDNLRAFIAESAKKTLSNLKIKKQEIEKAIAKIKTSLQSFPDKERQLVVFTREVKIKEQLYNHLIEKQTEYGIAESSDISMHQIIDAAEVPTASIWPNKPLIYGVALFFALFAGLLIAYLKHFLFATIKGKQDLNHLVNVPVLGAIRRMKKKDSRIETFSGLYTNLEILKKNDSSESRAQVVTISSMKSGEGKTFTTVNLSKTSEQIGKKVLLIDLDMRKPSVHSAFDLPNVKGVSAILKGNTLIKDAIVPFSDNLDVLVAGELEGIPSAFVFSSRAEELVSMVRDHYDLIVFDTPPVGLVPDALLLMKISDVNLFVTRYGRTKIRTARSLNALIKEWDIPNIFTLLNYDKKRKTGYYYYHGKKSKSKLSELVPESA